MMRKAHSITSAGRIAALVVLLTTASSQASSVVPMTIERLANHAGQVIVGELASAQSYWAEEPRRIETRLVFQKSDYLKGRTDASGNAFELTIPGGKVGDVEMKLCCAPVFKVGERYLLFLLPTYKTFPTAGLGQGAFWIRTDADGKDRVYHTRDIPVLGLDAEGFVQLAAEPQCDAHLHATPGKRIRVLLKSKRTAKAIAYDDFISAIGPILDRSKDHKLSQPAGRRILVELRPVPLQRSPKSQETPNEATSKRMRGTNSVNEVTPTATQQRGDATKPEPEDADTPNGQREAAQ